MPTRRTEPTPVEEIEAFSRRMIDQVEDFESYRASSDWQTFTNQKFTQRSGQVLTNAQVEALEFGRLPLVEFEQRVGVKAEFPFKSRPDVIRYRDVTGEFQTRGTFVSRSQLAGRIEYLKRFGL